MKKALAVVLALLAPLAAAAAEWSSRPLSELAVYPEHRALAQAVATNEARLAAEVGGRIEALSPRVGEAVTKGQEVARIDAASYRIALEQARAQAELVENRIRLAEAQLAQARALAGRGYTSADAQRVKETELAVHRSELDAARQSVAAAQLQLRRTVVRAPYAGIVRERLASVGDLAAPGTALLVLSAVGDTEIHARVPAAQVASLKAAGSWRLVAGEASYALQLKRVSPVVDAAGQAQDAVLVAKASVPPGLAGELRWKSRVPHLPSGYVQQREGALGAWVVRQGAPVFVPLPRAEVGRPVAVDWSPDTAVVDAGRFGLGLAGGTRAAGAAAGQGAGSGR